MEKTLLLIYLTKAYPMRKLMVFTTIAVFFLMIQACDSKSNSNMDADSITSTDSLNALKDSSGNNMPADKNDVKFATEAASGGMTEVILGKLAMQKGTNKRVKNFGAMMIKDHGKANNKLMTLAKSKNITLPTTPNDEDQKVINTLSKKSGIDFDKAYIADMIDDHENDIKEFDNASKSSGDADIKAFATKTLPMLKNHLEAINTISGTKQ
jgi:putative membrane protein